MKILISSMLCMLCDTSHDYINVDEFCNVLSDCISLNIDTPGYNVAALMLVL